MGAQMLLHCIRKAVNLRAVKLMRCSRQGGGRTHAICQSNQRDVVARKARTAIADCTFQVLASDAGIQSNRPCNYVHTRSRNFLTQTGQHVRKADLLGDVSVHREFSDVRVDAKLPAQAPLQRLDKRCRHPSKIPPLYAYAHTCFSRPFDGVARTVLVRYRRSFLYGMANRALRVCVRTLLVEAFVASAFRPTLWMQSHARLKEGATKTRPEFSQSLEPWNVIPSGGR